MRTMLLAALVLFGSAVGVAAQQPVPDPEALKGPGPIERTAEQISQELWPLEGAGQPVFRSKVEVNYFTLQAPWIETDEEQSRYARPRGGSSYHQQYLRDVTPEAFRGSTLYPAGVGVDPVVIVNGIRSAWRGWQEGRIRARIADELAALERARAAAGLPPGVER